MKRRISRRTSTAAALAAILILTGTSIGMIRRIMPRNGPAAAGGIINLPYQSADNQGNQWMLYNAGMLQMQGNMPLFTQANRLMINGNQINSGNNQATVDDKTGEIVVENMQAGSLSISRRFLFDQEAGYVRVIDVFKNPTNQEQQANLQWMTNVNFGIQQQQMVHDSKKKDRNIAWLAQTGAGPKAAIVIFAGQKSKFAPEVTAPVGNDFVQATLNYPVPAGKQIAIVTLLATAPTMDAATQMVNELKDAKVLANIPRDLRKSIINYRIGSSPLGDMEILRGDVLDVVELRGGDRLNGTILETEFSLDTFYGPIVMPVDKVVGLLNVGQFQPRQLLITSDGQILGGKMKKETIELQLSSGQKTLIPLSQISRVGYRRRANETDDENSEAVVNLPVMAIMSSGERIAVTLPPAGIDFVTRYGLLSIAPEALASISFLPEEGSVHTVFLTDGSRINGLVASPNLDFSVPAGPDGKAINVKFPVGSMRQLNVKPRSEDQQDDSQPSLVTKKDDVLAGVLQGQMKLQTPWDAITVNAAEVRAMSHPHENAPDVTVTVWDGSTSSGQLQQQDLVCKLQSGTEVHVPLSLVQSYSNPQAQAPAIMLERIKALVADLNANDFKQRETAGSQLLKLGPGVAGVLKGMRDSQPPEAQQRIDGILKQIAKQQAAAAKANAGGGGGAPIPGDAAQFPVFFNMDE